ncbi:MAG: hypothetical protein Q9160_006022 [Pyrenula sp. 1 TL-2023]
MASPKTLSSFPTPTIPTLDISPFLSNNASSADLQPLIDGVSSACHNYGFFYLVGHGIPLQDQEKALQCAKRFFELSMEERMEVWIRKSVGMSFRGYEPPGGQRHGRGLLPDAKEAFIFGAEISPDHPDSGTFSMGPNQWPKSIPDEDFRILLMNYQAKMVGLVKELLKILARGLPAEWKCPPDVFEAAAASNPVIPVRLLHYAPQTVKDERQFGEPNTEGLEVFYPRTESWIPVPVKENSLVINIGDVMQKWTGGYYRSARHRVVTSTSRHRYSVPFFLNGDLKLRFRALDGSGEEIAIGEHIRNRVMETVGIAVQAHAQIPERDFTP